VTVLQSPAEIEVTGPLVYLAGPISDTVNWQSRAVRYLQKTDATIHVANPRGARPFHIDAANQYKWEQKHLALAGKQGAILFWMARPQSSAGPDYALRSLFCLGEWATRGSTDVVVGIEDGFPGETYLCRRLAESFPYVPVCKGLRQACTVAVSLIRRRAEFVAGRHNDVMAAVGLFTDDDE